MAVNQLLLLDLTEEIQHLLCAADRKGGDHHVAAPVKGPLQDLRQRRNIINHLFVAAVAVGGLDDDIVRRVDPLRIVQDRLVFISHVA